MSTHRRSNYHFNWRLIITVVLFSLILISLSCWLILRSLIAPVTQVNQPSKQFIIKRGTSAKSIAQQLYNAGLIRSPLGFRYILYRYHLVPKLQAGIYQLSPSLSSLEIAQALTKGIADVVVTIPEGYRVEQIATVLSHKLAISTSDFIKSASHLEGYLFPDTYYFAPHTNSEQIIATMTQNFNQKVGEIDKQTLILASLVERETRSIQEKPIVAGILNNRLQAHWPLELDATIQYVLGTQDNWWPQTTLLDRQVKSAYNTYLHQGLPPTPICNPGLASINAVRHPTKTSYWFYLHDRNGKIHYAETNFEHNHNIDTYLH